MASRVFFPEFNQRFDFKPAEFHGSIHFLSESRLNALDPDALIEIIDESLERHQFDPANDFFGLTGQMDLTAVVFGHLARKYEPLRYLIFDFRNGSYVERVLRARSR